MISDDAIPYAQYRRALAYVVPYWRGLLVVMLLGLFSTAVGLVQPYISRLLIDDALLRRNLHALTIIALRWWWSPSSALPSTSHPAIVRAAFVVMPL